MLVPFNNFERSGFTRGKSDISLIDLLQLITSINCNAFFASFDRVKFVAKSKLSLPIYARLTIHKYEEIRLNKQI